MSIRLTTLRLTELSKQLLQYQVSLNGTFHHTLRSVFGNTQLRVAVSIEQCANALELLVTFAGNRHTTSVVLEKRRADTAARAARFVEHAANGESLYDVPEPGEHELASEMELSLRGAIRAGQGTWFLTADELEPTLWIDRTSRGYIAKIQLDEATSYVTLPRDTQRAYALLADTMHRFLQGYRDALAADA